MSRLSRSGSLRNSSSVSPPTSSPLRPSAVSKSTSPSSPSPLSGIFSPHKRKDPPSSTVAEYDGIEEEDEEESSGDSADDGSDALRPRSFAAEHALATSPQRGNHYQPLQTVAEPAKPSIMSPTPTQAAVRASALTAALSAVRGQSPSSTQTTPSPNTLFIAKQTAVIARPVSPANSSPLSVTSPSVSASAPLPATVLRGVNSTATSMELDEDEYVNQSPSIIVSQPLPPSRPLAASPPPSASTTLDWPPSPSLSQLSDPSTLPSLRLSSGQRERLASQLSQHIDLTLSLRRLLSSAVHPTSADSDTAAGLHRKAGDMLTSLCALRVAHQRMYTQHSVLDVPQLDRLQQRLNSSPFDSSSSSSSSSSWSTGNVVAVQPAMAAAVVPKGSPNGTRATIAGVVTATAVQQYAMNGWHGGAAMATVMHGQPVMATLGTATPATVYSTATAAAARLMSHSSAPAGTALPVAARQVQPAHRSSSSAVMAASTASSSPHAVGASPAAGSLTSALSSLSSSLASFANSPHYTRSPTPLMANLSLYPPQMASPATAVTATVMAVSPSTSSSFTFSPSSIDHSAAAVSSPATARSPPTASPASALSASLRARSPASPGSGFSPVSPSGRSTPVVPAVAVSSDAIAASTDARITPVSSSFTAQSELSSLDSFAALALASYSPSTNSSPLSDSALSTLASLAHTDVSFGDSPSAGSPNSQPAHTTAPVSASSRSSSYRSSEQPNKRSRSQSQHEPDLIVTSSSSSIQSLGLRKNRSQQGLSRLDTTRTASPLPAATSHHPRLSSSSSFSSLSSALSATSATALSPSSPLPASGSFATAVPASAVSNHSPRRRTYSPRTSARRVVAASVVVPAEVQSSISGGSDGVGFLSPHSMQAVAALWSGHDESGVRMAS